MIEEWSENERLIGEIPMLNWVFEMFTPNVVLVSSTESTMSELTPFQRGSGPWPVRICFLRLSVVSIAVSDILAFLSSFCYL